ncbi:hypothetical protein [Brachyspira innocens]|uniref:hypothetical protein n=1 Tax=Brachyspira innocens TaxID=13264 RepID=UPI0026EC2356|nr:hypothetical protein [Brachyspira innocens]
MNKKIIFKLLILVLALSLFAVSCADKNPASPSGGDSGNTEQPGGDNTGGSGNTGEDQGNTNPTLGDRNGMYFGGKGLFFVGDGVVSTLSLDIGEDTWSIVNNIILGSKDSTETSFFFNSIEVKKSNTETTKLVSVLIEFIDDNNVQVTIEGTVGTYKRPQ